MFILKKNIDIYILLVLVLHLLCRECDAKRGGGGSGSRSGGSISRGGGGWFSRGSSRISGSTSYSGSKGSSYGWSNAVIGGRNVIGNYKTFGKPSRWSLHKGQSFYYVGYPYRHYHHGGYYGYRSEYGKSEIGLKSFGMGATALILLILFLIGVGLALYYAVICLQAHPPSEKRPRHPDMGPLLPLEQDLNGNNEEDPLGSPLPQHQLLDQPDSAAMSKQNDADPEAPPSNQDSLKEDNLEPPLKSIMFQTTPECASKEPPKEGSVVLPIDEEPSVLDSSKSLLSHTEPRPQPLTQPPSITKQSHGVTPLSVLAPDCYEEDGLRVPNLPAPRIQQHAAEPRPEVIFPGNAVPQHYSYPRKSPLKQVQFITPFFAPCFTANTNNLPQFGQPPPSQTDNLLKTSNVKTPSSQEDPTSEIAVVLMAKTHMVCESKHKSEDDVNPTTKKAKRSVDEAVISEEDNKSVSVPDDVVTTSEKNSHHRSSPDQVDEDEPLVLGTSTKEVQEGGETIHPASYKIPCPIGWHVVSPSEENAQEKTFLPIESEKSQNAPETLVPAESAAAQSFILPAENKTTAEPAEGHIASLSVESEDPAPSAEVESLDFPTSLAETLSPVKVQSSTLSDKIEPPFSTTTHSTSAQPPETTVVEPVEMRPPKHECQSSDKQPVAECRPRESGSSCVPLDALSPALGAEEPATSPSSDSAGGNQSDSQSSGSSSSEPDVTEYSFQSGSHDACVATVLANEVSSFSDEDTVGLTNYATLTESAVLPQEKPCRRNSDHPPTPTAETTKCPSPIDSSDTSLEVNHPIIPTNVLGTPPSTPPCIIENPSAEEAIDTMPTFIVIEPHKSSRERLESTSSSASCGSLGWHASSSLASSSTSNGSYKIEDNVKEDKVEGGPPSGFTQEKSSDIPPWLK